MIKVTSANNNQTIYINHKKIEIIKPIGQNLHITLDNKNTYIVKEPIEDIQSEIIKFEGLKLRYATNIKNDNKEVRYNG